MRLAIQCQPVIAMCNLKEVALIIANPIQKKWCM